VFPRECEIEEIVSSGVYITAKIGQTVETGETNQALAGFLKK